MKNLNFTQTSLNDLATTITRITLGIMFVAHAHLKYFTFTLPGTAQFFASLGLPADLAYVTFVMELIGGILLIIGFQTRYVALLLIPILLGATWAHSGNGWVFSAPNGGYEYPVFLTIVALVQVLLGDGYLAIKKSTNFLIK